MHWGDAHEEAVCGDGAEDVVSVEAEIAEVGVDGGAGASELSGDLHGGDAGTGSCW